MEDNNYKEVYFGEYCKTCKYKTNTDEEAPCDECLNHPVNVNSHKPVKYEENKK